MSISKSAILTWASAVWQTCSRGCQATHVNKRKATLTLMDSIQLMTTAALWHWLQQKIRTSISDTWCQALILEFTTNQTIVCHPCLYSTQTKQFMEVKPQWWRLWWPHVGSCCHKNFTVSLQTCSASSQNKRQLVQKVMVDIATCLRNAALTVKYLQITLSEFSSRASKPLLFFLLQLLQRQHPTHSDATF